MKEEAEKEANLYPRARLPLATASARFTVGHFDSIGKRPLMVCLFHCFPLFNPGITDSVTGGCHDDDWKIPRAQSRGPLWSVRRPRRSPCTSFAL